MVLSIALSACSASPEVQSESGRLTQADLDNYIRALSDPALAEAKRDEKARDEVLQTHGLTYGRAAMIYLKIFMCKCLVDGEDDPEFECDLGIFDKDIWPDKAEVELYRNNETALEQAAELSLQLRTAQD